MSQPLPHKLQPLILRSGIKFQDLKDHIWTDNEMAWICEEIDKKHALWMYQVTSIKAISRRYNIYIDGLRRWMRLYKAGIPFSAVNTCTSADDCPFDKLSLKRIYTWQYSRNRCPVELDSIIDQELDNSYNRKRYSF